MAVLRALSWLVMLASAGASVGPSSNNSFCTESKECLQYQLLCKTDEYEVRHYSPTLWVSTDAEAYFMGVGAAMAFRRLFQYITGDNQGGFQIDMTAPVLVKIPEETTMWEPAIYTLSFPLPQAYQENPPQPTNDQLYFTEMPDMDVYVRSYGGWMLSVTSRLQAHQLTKELDRVGAKYNCTHHYGVGYDSPLKLLNRHNEVWYVSEGKPVCSDPQEPTPPHPPRPRTEAPVEDPPKTPSSPPSPSSSPQTPAQDPDSASSQDPPIQEPKSSSLPDLPVALALSAATPSPQEQSTPDTPDRSEQSAQSSSPQPEPGSLDTNTSTAEQITQSPPDSSSEEITQSTPDSSRESTKSTQDAADSPGPIEQSTHSSPGLAEQSTLEPSEQSTHGSTGPSEQSTHNSTGPSEQSTHSSTGSSEQSTHGTPVSSEQKTQSTPSLTHDTPLTTEKST